MECASRELGNKDVFFLFLIERNTQKELNNNCNAYFCLQCRYAATHPIKKSD